MDVTLNPNSTSIPYHEGVAPAEEKVGQVAREKMVLHIRRFREEQKGFDLFYGEKEGRFIPISAKEGKILEASVHPVTGSPDTRICRIDIRDETTKRFLAKAIETAKANSDTPAYRMLEALTPYAEQISETFDIPPYATLTELFSSLALKKEEK